MSFFTYTADHCGNNEDYEKVWMPKILAYRKKLEDSVVKEYLAPEEFLPKSMDEQFDATTVPAKVLSPEELAITESSAVDLVAKLQSGELTAVETFTAFAKRATIAYQLTHCVMEFFIEEGMDKAKELDEILAKTGKPVGPLHGLPVSVKEHFGMKDRVTHAGYVGFLDNVTKEDCLSTKILREAGAIIYLRTSEPQSLMHECSDNNITGRTGNAYNTSLSAGGSSSGEGAITAMKGSAMGVGSDIGGSIRAPAAFNGVWGLRPSTKRISLEGLVAAGGGQESVYPVMGPLARSGEDIELFMKTYAASEPWKRDISLIPLEWREAPIPKPTELTVAMFYDDEVVKPHPPIKRALDYAAKKLEEAGVKVVKWDQIKCRELFETCFKFYTADGNSHQKEALALSGEPLLPLTKWAFSMGNGDNGISVSENHDMNVFRDDMRAEYHRVLDEKKIDYILGPTYVGCAPRPSTLHFWGYCSYWNILDMPGLIFPTGLHQDPEIDVKEEGFKPRNEYEEYEHSLYEPEYFKNAALCVQLNGRRYSDEKLVKAGIVLEEIIRA